MLDAIDCMVAVLAPRDEPVLLVSTVDDRGLVGPGEALSLNSGLPDDDSLFCVARSVSAHAVLFGSRAARSVFDPEREDVELTAALLQATDREGIEVIEHVLVEGPRFRLMCESLRNGSI